MLGVHLGERAAACLIGSGGEAVSTSESQQDRDPAAVRRDALGRVFGRVPARAIAACLEWARVRLDEIDLAIVTSEVVHAPGRPPRALCVADCVLQLPWSPHTRMHAIDHHLAHACSAFYPSGLEAAAVLVLDRGGGVVPGGLGAPPRRMRASAYRASRRGLERVLTGEDGEGGEGGDGGDGGDGPAASSAGAVAELFSAAILGATEIGPLMELAAAGGDRLRSALAPHWELTAGGFRVSPALQPEGFAQLPGGLAGAFGLPARPGDDPAACADAAWAVRDLLERVAGHLGQLTVERAGSRHLCLAGEAAVHGLARVAPGEPPWADSIYAPPVPGEAGAAVGAALYGWCCVADEPPPPAPAIEQAFRGRAWSDADVAAAISAQAAAGGPSAAGDAEGDAEGSLDALAELLAGGAVVAWFDGGAELAGGAVGGRCVLADARRARPHLAARAWTASVLAEDAAGYFELAGPSPFAHRLARVAPARAAHVPLVVRGDGMARVHTVDRARAPRLHALLRRFARRAGTPLLAASSLTSPPLGLGGGLAPETPEDAIALWRAAGLDALYLQGHLLLSTVLPQTAARAAMEAAS